MDLGDLNKVWEIKTLKKPGEEEARRMLERVAKQVQPIMRRRKWRVKKLSEFCPANPALLGLNVGGGTEVKLRLRRPNRDWDFFPFEQVIDTMLHELCHIEHGPHNARFYKLWDEIRKECEELMSKGITGTGHGFDAPGRRLGGYTLHHPLPSLRQTAVAAAQKRARIESLLPSGPQRLGGNGDIMTALSPIQAAAMAAERRMYDDLWCGSGYSNIFSEVDCSSGLSKQPTFTKSGEPSKSSNGVTQGKNSDVDDSTSSGRSGGAPLSGGSSSQCTADDTEDQVIWECIMCTLLNQPPALVCEACGTKKPKDVGSKFKTWSCKFCTFENSIKSERCSVCDQWRYSKGPPVSTPGPNYGT